MSDERRWHEVWEDQTTAVNPAHCAPADPAALSAELDRVYRDATQTIATLRADIERRDRRVNELIGEVARLERDVDALQAQIGALR